MLLTFTGDDLPSADSDPFGRTALREAMLIVYPNDDAQQSTVEAAAAQPGCLDDLTVGQMATVIGLVSAVLINAMRLPRLTCSSSS